MNLWQFVWYAATETKDGSCLFQYAGVMLWEVSDHVNSWQEIVNVTVLRLDHCVINVR